MRRTVAILAGNTGPRSLVGFPHKTHILLVTHHSEHELTREKKPTLGLQDSWNWALNRKNPERLGHDAYPICASVSEMEPSR